MGAREGVVKKSRHWRTLLTSGAINYVVTPGQRLENLATPSVTATGRMHTVTRHRELPAHGTTHQKPPRTARYRTLGASRRFEVL